MELNIFFASANIKFKRYLVGVARKARLFSPCGLLAKTYKEMLENPEDEDWAQPFAVAFDGVKPIGLIMVTRTKHNMIWIYVKPEYRKQGVGKALTAYMRKTGYRISGHRTGTKMGTAFFEKIGLLT